MPRRHRTGLTRLWRYTEGKGRRIPVLAVASALAAAAPVTGWLLVGRAVDAARAGDVTRLTLLVGVYVAVNAVGWVLGTFVWRGVTTLGQEIVLDLRRDLFQHLTSLSLRYFSEQRAGWIIARLTSDVDALSDVLSQGLATVVSSVLMLVAAVIGLFVLDWRLGLVALVVLPPGILVVRWFQRRAGEAFADVRTRISSVTAQIAESIAGMAVVQAFNRERAVRSEFDKLNRENLESNTVAQRLMSVFFPAIEWLGVVATIAVLYVGATFHAGGTLTVGTLIAAVGLLALVFQPLQELSELFGQVQSASAAMGKITSVLDAQPDLRDRSRAERLPRLDGRIDIDRVTFAYGETPVLQAVEVHVPPGGCIALVGESGGGKSTLAKLIGRFYDPDEGAIRVDERDLRDVQLRSYRRQLGVVLQDPFLFSGTIADNIRFGRPEATEDEVWAALRGVGVDDYVRALPAQLDTEIGERGIQLSAGQRQLVAFARALLADPRIVILDEATSNVDLHTEGRIETGLRRLLAGRTAIVIAHRLSTIRQAGRIVVLDHGRIAEQGTHDELLTMEGAYWRLYRDWAEQAAA